LTLVAVVSLGLPACSSSRRANSTPVTASGSRFTAASGSTSNDGLKLGFFGALTGADAQLGINIEDGEKLAVAQYMATNPAVPVTIDPFDSQGDQAQASNGATKLIGDHVVAVIGPSFPGESAAADPVFERGGIPNVSASATTVELAQNGWKYFHRVLGDDSAQGQGDGDHIVKTLGKTQVAVIDDDSTYGAGLASYVNGSVESDGGTVVATDHVDPAGSNYGSTVDKIVASKATAVFYGGYYDAAGRLVNQLRKAGYTGVFISGDGSEDPRFMSDAGGAPAEGSYLSCACADETQNPGAASFDSAYSQMLNTAPQIYSAEAYDATNFVLAAIRSGAKTPSAINAYLTTKTWPGVTKTIRFLPDGNVFGGTIFLYEVENGKIVQIGTTS
jgi:branched-chain amino acid transport system substrate-binding protein